MVDLGISRTQDIQNPLPANAPAARVPAEAQERETRSPAVKSARRSAPAASAGEAHPADLEAEVKRINDLMGANTRIRFVINRSTNDVYIEVVDKETRKVLKTIPPSELRTVAGKLSGGGMLVDNRL